MYRLHPGLPTSAPSGPMSIHSPSSDLDCMKMLLQYEGSGEDGAMKATESSFGTDGKINLPLCVSLGDNVSNWWATNSVIQD